MANSTNRFGHQSSGNPGPDLAFERGFDQALDQAPDQAMTEIALALAMAFFSIMVLAMVSMGVPAADTNPATSMELVASGSGDQTQVPPAERQLVVLHQDRFFDDGLNEIAPGELEGPLTLAIDPAIAMADAIKARNRIAHDDVLVSTLDQPWLARLKEFNP